MLLSFRSLGAWWPALALFLCAPAGAEELFSTLAGYAAHNCAEGSYFWDASRFGDPRFTDRFEMAADDFVVPAEVDGWRVRRIDVRGEVEDDWGGLPASLSVYVLGDVDGAPESIDLAGAAIYFATEVPYVEPERGDFLIDLPGDGALLPPGRYWLVVRADAEVDLDEVHWKWATSSSGIQYPDGWLKPLGLLSARTLSEDLDWRWGTCAGA